MGRCARCFGDIRDLAVFCPNCAQLHEPDFNKLIDQTVGNRYQIYRCLSQGGLSTVFAATDLQSDRVVVIKVSDPAQLVRREMSYSIDPVTARQYWAEMLERMRREAETLATINHPNIVRLYGTGMIDEDLRYVIMEYLHGRTLREEIDRKRRFIPDDAIHIALEICSALSDVHSRGIIHRDINPRNIMFADSKTNGSHQSAIKLIDFGIAKFPQPAGAPPFTHHSALSGTVAYASPEQCQSRSIDHRADIYSLGVVIYEMLTGQRPFNGRTPTEIALKQIQSEPLPPRVFNPELPGSLESAVLRALAKNPDNRQQSIEELRMELGPGASQIVIPLQIDDSAADADISDEVDEVRAVRRRRRRAVLAATAILPAIITAGILFGRSFISSHPIAISKQENIATASSPLPKATVSTDVSNLLAGISDADAMEAAARLSQYGVAKPITTPAPAGASPQTQPVIRPSAPKKSALARSTTGKQSHQPAPPDAKPQAPPAPSPIILATRLPEPTSQPDITQAPRTEDNQNEDNNRTANRRVTPDNDDSRPSQNRNRGSDNGSSNSTGRDDDDRDARDNRQNVGPKIIQWNGSVYRERVIKIEMPGVPGTIEIPRVFRDRVGVVEPPNSDNDWSCAVLRVFGRGRVSILVRWWPLAQNAAKFAARR